MPHLIPSNLPSGCLLLDKQPGYTSFESLGIVKRTFGTRKAGHTGTLDRFASGLLVVLMGTALKFVSQVTGLDKHYDGVIRFGAETDTLDPEGAVIATAPAPGLPDLEAVLPQFRGDIMQTPPVYSAVHVQGKRAAARARSGAPVALAPRPVAVYMLELVSYDPPDARVQVHCSKGTYIRSLARDIGRAVGSRAYLTTLRRTRVGGVSVTNAVNPWDAADPAALLTAALRPVDQELLDLFMPVERL